MAASVKPKETSRIVLLAKLYTPFGGVSIPGVRVYICHKMSKEKTKKNPSLYLVPFTCDTAAILLSHLPSERVVQTCTHERKTKKKKK